MHRCWWRHSSHRAQLPDPTTALFELGSSGFTAAKKDQVAFVVASVKKDDTSWIAALPEWSHHIYFIDDFYAYLRVSVNKGREAMVYLT
jgi:hypothetical protein